MTVTVQLRRVARLAYGDSLAAESRVDGEYPVVGSGGVSGTHNKRNFRAPGIVIGRKGSYGSVHWIERGGFAIDTAYYIDERMTTADLRWLYYVLQGIDLRGTSQDVGVPGLSREAAYAADIPSPPPLDEQRRIADFLDAETARIDKLTALREKMNSLLSQRRERIIDQEIGAAGGATNDFVPLRYLIDRVGVGIVITPAAWYVDATGVPALRGVNIKPGDIDDANLVHISEEGNVLHRKSQLAAGDVVVVRTGQAGTAAVVPPELAGANCIDLVIIKPSDRLVPRYLEYVLNSDYAKDFVVENSVGTIQSHFNVSAMKRIPVPSISLARQQESVRKLDEEIGAIDRLRAGVDRQRGLLAERRQALITAAVTGEFDVSAASGRGIEE